METQAKARVRTITETWRFEESEILAEMRGRTIRADMLGRRDAGGDASAKIPGVEEMR